MLCKIMKYSFYPVRLVYNKVEKWVLFISIHFLFANKSGNLFDLLIYVI